MTTAALVDPILTSVPNNDKHAFAILNAVNGLLTLCSTFPVTLGRHLDDATYQAMIAWVRNSHRGAAAAAARLLNQLYCVEQATCAPAVMKCRPTPNLPADWLALLAQLTQTEEPPRWREPVIITTEFNEQWPERGAVGVEVAGRTYNRLLTDIESAARHAAFVRTFDPWLYQDTVEDMETPHRRLPRPPAIPASVPLGVLADNLAAITTAFVTHPDGEYYFYVPPLQWQPTRQHPHEWFDRRSFPIGKKTTLLGLVQGPIDRFGRVWRWPEGANRGTAESHWDVQDPDERKKGSYMNVSHTGRILKTVE